MCIGRAARRWLATLWPVHDQHERAGGLYGVGVGPGDPELVTLQGVRVLREADVVFVPVADTGEQGRAERIVLAHVTAPPRRLVFALTTRAPVMALGTQPAREVADAFAAGARSAAFATIGDPNIYSTFTYLAATVRELVPDLEVATVPGITAMQALAASSGKVLVEGRESLALMPLTAGVGKLSAALKTHDPSSLTRAAGCCPRYSTRYEVPAGSTVPSSAARSGCPGGHQARV